MATNFSENACRNYIRCMGQSQSEPGAVGQARPRPFVTLSHQSGAGGFTTTEKLTGYLNRKLDHERACHWTAFDDELIDQCLAEHHLPEGFAKYLAEEKASAMTDMLDELFGAHPSRSRLVRRVAETILHLAHMGNCIIVGRGAAVVTRNLPQRVSVRLVGSLKQRIHHIMDYYGMSRPEAADYVQREDARRAAYVREYLNQDINDPLLYHLVINTDDVSYEETAHIIGDLVWVRQAAAAAAVLV